MRALAIFLACAGAIASPVLQHRRGAFRAGAGAWLDTNYSKRIAVTIDATQVSSTLTDFPVFVRLSDLPASFFTTVQADGDDIRASSDDHTTELDVELVAIDTGASTGELHVSVPSVDSATDTVFYLYYGYGSATAYATPENVFGASGAGYMHVYHLSTAANAEQINSSRSDGNTTLDANNFESGDSVAGKVGNAVIADGSNEYYAAPQSEAASYLQPDGSFTLSMWLKADTFASDTYYGNQMNSTTGGISLWIWSSALRAGYGGTAAAWNNITYPTSSMSTGTWYHVVAKSNGSTGRLIVNNVEVDSGSVGSSHSWALYPLYLFRREDGSGYADGTLDEIRLHDTELSSAWIGAEYVNQNTPTSFYTIGTEETQ